MGARHAEAASIRPSIGQDSGQFRGYPTRTRPSTNLSDRIDIQADGESPRKEKTVFTGRQVICIKFSSVSFSALLQAPSSMMIPISGLLAVLVYFQILASVNAQSRACNESIYYGICSRRPSYLSLLTSL